jgi:rare lipoprotein A (peptidoglycan hydrolase)
MKPFILGLLAGFIAVFIINPLQSYEPPKLQNKPVQIKVVPSPRPSISPEPTRAYRVGQASWYGQEICGGKIEGCRTANGEIFDDTLHILSV